MGKLDHSYGDSIDYRRNIYILQEMLISFV